MTKSVPQPSESVFDRDRWFWQDDYRHPVEYGFSGWAAEMGDRIRDVVLWTIGLAVLPVLLILLAIAAVLLLALVEAGLISPPDEPKEEQPVESIHIIAPATIDAGEAAADRASGSGDS